MEDIIPVVAACIMEGGKLYLSKRRFGYSPEELNRWEYPGGKVEEESLEEALVREIKEELFWDISIQRLLHAQVNIYSNSGPYLVLYFLCYKKDPTQEANPKVELVWLEPEEVQYWNPLPGTAEAAGKLFKKYIPVLEKHSVEQTSDFTLTVLTSEIGKLHTLKYNKERFGNIGYIGDERIELGDIITMANLLSEQKGYDLSELEREGLDRFDDRISEVRKKLIEDQYGNKEK